jgi:acyl-CoA synthetase (AMP-forming)/AMP-acid ligase II
LASVQPDLDFAIQNTRQISCRQAATESDRLANALAGAGLRAGDRVAVLAKNSIEYAVLYFAASKAEVVLVPLNYRLAPPEWAFIINDAQVKMLFAAREYLTPIDAIRAELPTVNQFVCLEPEESAWASVGEWMSRQPGACAERSESENPDVVQMYTSGTTGRPKGAVLTHQSLISAAEACMPWFTGEPAERYLLALPMFHIFGAAVTLTTTLVEGTMLIMPEFQPAAVIRALREEKIVVASLVPVMSGLCQSPGCRGRRIRDPEVHDLRGFAHRRSHVATRHGSFSVRFSPGLRDDRNRALECSAAG